LNNIHGIVISISSVIFKLKGAYFWFGVAEGLLELYERKHWSRLLCMTMFTGLDRVLMAFIIDLPHSDCEWTHPRVPTAGFVV